MEAMAMGGEFTKAYAEQQTVKTSQQTAVRPARGEREVHRKIQQAYVEWLCAQHRLDVVLDEAEVDYAIHALTVAEKRYSMLLKQAKNQLHT
jgi:hypothetical protein